MITLQEARDEVEKILKEKSWDIAEVLEYKLWFDVLIAIAKKAKYPDQLAREALRTRGWEE